MMGRKNKFSANAALSAVMRNRVAISRRERKICVNMVNIVSSRVLRISGNAYTITYVF